VRCLRAQVSFFFYKNLLFGLTIYFYNALCFFSGQIIYNGMLPVSLAHVCMHGCRTSCQGAAPPPSSRACTHAWLQCT
jgi:hypothetical protein